MTVNRISVIQPENSDMQQKSRRFLFLVLISCLVYNCAAIVAGGAAAGGAIWYKGELKESIAGSVSSVHTTAIQSMKSLKFTVNEQNHDEVQGEIKGEMANGTDVRIYYEIRRRKCHRNTNSCRHNGR